MYGLLRLAIRDICGRKREQSRYPRHMLHRTKNELNRARIREKQRLFFLFRSLSWINNCSFFFYVLLQDSRSQEQPLAACLGAYAGVGMAGAASGADSACRFCLAVERNGDRFNSTGEGFPSYLLIGGPLELVVLLGEANLLHHVPAATGGGGNNRVSERERDRGEEPGIGWTSAEPGAGKSIRAERETEITSCARPCGGRGRRSRRRPGRSAPPPRTAPSPPSFLAGLWPAPDPRPSQLPPPGRRRCCAWLLPLRLAS